MLFKFFFRSKARQLWPLAVGDEGLILNTYLYVWQGCVAKNPNGHPSEC